MIYGLWVLTYFSMPCEKWNYSVILNGTYSSGKTYAFLLPFGIDGPDQCFSCFNIENRIQITETITLDVITNFCCLWLIVQFIQDSLVAICWERAVPLVFNLFCFYFSAFLIVGVPLSFDVLGQDVEFDCIGSWSLHFYLLHISMFSKWAATWQNQQSELAPSKD